MHVTVDFTWRRSENEHGNEVLRSMRCAGCGKTLSMGPSNDASESVQIEIRAARKIAELVFDQNCDPSEWDFRTDGLLVIATWNEEPGPWPWDPSRPVAGQYEEWVAANRSAGPWCSRCGDAFDAPERECPSPAPGRPYKDCGRGGHMFNVQDPLAAPKDIP